MADFADRDTGRVLEEMRQALLAACSNQLMQLLANRRDDGALEPPTRGDVSAAAIAALEALRPEKDDFGERVPWQVTFRRRKREAREAAGLQPTIPDGITFWYSG